MDFLKSAVASAISKGPLGAYIIGDKVDSSGSIWSLNNAVKRDGNVKCSLFTFELNTNRSRTPLARNAVRKARTLHHPGVVKVLDTIETDAHIYIVTECLTPLGWSTRRKSLGTETIKWGLWSVAKTIRFINDEAASVHGCIKTAAIFTTESGEWKLGGFELLSSLKDEEASLAGLVPDINRTIPPEVGKGGWDALKHAPLPAADAYGFAVLIYESFHGTLATQDQLSRPSDVPAGMQQAYKRLINANPKMRLSVGHFLEQGRRDGGFLHTPLISLTEGIERLGLMSEPERDTFLSQLDEAGEAFPQDFTTRKILPELLKSVEYGGGGARVFEAVLKIGAKLSDDEYDALLTPVLVRLFASADRAIRVCLLESLHLMIDHLSSKIVNDKVFPNMVTGFTDIAPIVREQTVKAVLTVISKLSDRIVNGELLKYLAKTANDAEPGIRTNTTICLGKIAKYLGKNTRSKVLIAAFTRSLRDPFVHARNAALMALAATSDTFTEDDCATKILPAICATLLDKEKIVRDQGNKALDQYVQRVRKHAQSMPDTALPPPSTANGLTATTTPRMGTPATDTSSWTGWAISSFTNKPSNAKGQIEPRANGAATSSKQPLQKQYTVAHTQPTVPNTEFSPLTPHHPPLTRSTTDTTKLAASFDDPHVTEVDDLWGDFGEENANGGEDAADAWLAMADDWDDHNEATPDRLSSTMSVRAGGPLSPSCTPDDNGEPDFAAWLQTKQNASKPSAKALPKGLAPSKTKTAIAVSHPPTRTSSSNAVATRQMPTVKSTHSTSKVEKGEEDEDWGEAWE
ncbi:MAG: hypothetical protein M1828_002848 [Chrysothrix sp. TS-e1954]|nr:MAG: hypothetical protein M1828_002848 [Chrysothrix sp. TS-e1954]